MHADPAASNTTSNPTEPTNMDPLAGETTDGRNTAVQGGANLGSNTGTLRRPESLIGALMYTSGISSWSALDQLFHQNPSRWEEHKKWTFKRNGYLCTLAVFNVILAPAFLATSDLPVSKWSGDHLTHALAFTLLFSLQTGLYIGIYYVFNYEQGQDATHHVWYLWVHSLPLLAAVGSMISLTTSVVMAFWLHYNTAGLAFRVLFTVVALVPMFLIIFMIVALVPMFLIIFMIVHYYFRHN
ncbi:hypothetical protein DEU56DRAFT_907005 [Suillus clintonianus]|uniref:uncharacterized protein n=1 Tax=Suillus clintonianus TaxID=1904413 RepID=UPI001B86EBFE|nr:uncharacterized protein DEU56DRAFT_907005 [Suillus clintonianus]KAG2154602.1 hypothetical protein DEU56DRAFT_907005 [Suillus clintonianus]